MNDYQARKLVDILPAPEVTTQTHGGWALWIAIAGLLLLVMIWRLLRSRRFGRFILRQQIMRQRIDSREAAARLLELAPANDQDLQRQLQQIRFGPPPLKHEALLELLRRIP